jgi:alcohol dehydrogenase
MIICSALNPSSVLGAGTVATTCSTSKMEYVRSLGADVIIDYKTTQFEDIVQDYDVVFDTLGE